MHILDAHRWMKGEYNNSPHTQVSVKYVWVRKKPYWCKTEQSYKTLQYMALCISIFINTTATAGAFLVHCCVTKLLLLAPVQVERAVPLSAIPYFTNQGSRANKSSHSELNGYRSRIKPYSTFRNNLLTMHKQLPQRSSVKSIPKFNVVSGGYMCVFLVLLCISCVFLRIESKSHTPSFHSMIYCKVFSV